MSNNKEYFSSIIRSIPFFWALFGILCVEIISFGASQFSVVNVCAFYLIIIATVVVSLIRLRYGVLILLAELFIGSKGYLFSSEILGQNVSLRLALFVAVFIVYLIWIIREKRIVFFSWPLWKHYTALIVVVCIAVIIGLINNYDYGIIFFDVNGFLFLGLIGPLTQSIKNKKEVQQVLAIFLVSVIAICVKTIILLFLFSQLDYFAFTLPEIYKWVRDTGVGEITRFPNGFSRIFFQSHIYIVISFFFFAFFLSWNYIKNQASLKDRYIILILIGLAASLLVVFLSYSRSFWVATIGVTLVLMVWLLVVEKGKFKQIAMLCVLLVSVFIIDYVIAFGIVNIPLPGHKGVSATSLLSERTKDIGAEPAASSRMQLLKPLLTASLEQPIFGKGFGATVTYQSADPRILEQEEGGLYTTHAFEWGYLGFLYKFGIIGLIIYGYLIYSIYKHGLKGFSEKDNERTQNIAILFGISALLVTHFFTPYLDHPLGIGWIMVSSLVLTIKNR